MRANDEAKKRLIHTMHMFPNQMVENYDALIELARRISEVDSVMIKLDPESVERAARNILGVGEKNSY